MQVYVSVLKWGTWGWSLISDRKYLGGTWGWSWISDRKYWVGGGGGLGVGLGSLTGSTLGDWELVMDF